jgi:hypothetical protein
MAYIVFVYMNINYRILSNSEWTDKLISGIG